MLEEAAIEFQILPIEAADELRTSLKRVRSAERTLPEEAEKTPREEEETDTTTPENPPPVAEQDEMPHPYPKYNDEPDAEAHVRAFLTTWQENHVSQRLVEPEAEK